MIFLYSQISIAVEKEGTVYRAFAYDKRGNNVSSAKAFDSGLAVSGLFENLRNIALETEAEQRKEGKE